jgi:hypothetical protein
MAETDENEPLLVKRELPTSTAPLPGETSGIEVVDVDPHNSADPDAAIPPTGMGRSGGNPNLGNVFDVGTDPNLVEPATPAIPQ